VKEIAATKAAVVSAPDGFDVLVNGQRVSLPVEVEVGDVIEVTANTKLELRQRWTGLQRAIAYVRGCDQMLESNAHPEAPAAEAELHALIALKNQAIAEASVLRRQCGLLEKENAQLVRTINDSKASARVD
jgi:hypothetical protein